DVDDMKAINDRYGHATGDAALVRVAGTLRALVRRDDHLFRWGGDEFLLIALDLDGVEFRSRLESLNARLRSGEPGVQVSHGSAEFSRADQLLDAVRRADVAMYAQKRERAALKRRAGINVIEGGSRGAGGGPRDASI
ncbi:MAG TPA: GGDEF domain-containing protein, partial [Tahibacter sp.]|nr:GGDEF domain-containing protein [Tahibacter sp.]